MLVDISKWNRIDGMAIKCIVSYDGTQYKGWQVQPGLKTIQGEIEQVLSMIHNHPVSIVGSGRTDTHVHALAQVFSFQSELELEPEQYQNKLNRMLPKDIRILKAEKVSDEFHARFDCIWKRYDYLVSTDPYNPFTQNYMGKCFNELDIDKMQEAAKCFLGTHDFTSFTSAKIHEDKNRVRTITRCEIIRHPSHIQMIFEGDGFLRYQVRMMAQTILEAGLNRLEASKVKEMIEAKDKHVCRYKADPCGLYLVEVHYKGD